MYYLFHKAMDEALNLITNRKNLTFYFQNTSTMSYSFNGKRALVTGAGAGIGRATALALAEMGAEVVALSKTKANLDSLKALNSSISTICVDIGNWDQTREEVVKHLPIHLLVNNAGTAKCEPVLDASPENFDLLFNVNLKAVLNVTQVAAKDLISRGQQGCVVNVSSQAGQRALKDHLLYGATKAALDFYTKSMALELAPKGIRVNAVAPTVTMTEMAKVGWSDEEKASKMISRIPQGKFAQVEDVVNAILYLLSDKSDMVNGHILAVDGGFLAA